MKCPLCKIGNINPPNKNQFIVKKKAIYLLRQNGYSIREIMNIMGYKSPHTVQHYLKKFVY